MQAPHEHPILLTLYLTPSNEKRQPCKRASAGGGKANWSPRMVKVLSFRFRVPSFELQNDPSQNLKNGLELQKSQTLRVPESSKNDRRKIRGKFLVLYHIKSFESKISDYGFRVAGYTSPATIRGSSGINRREGKEYNIRKR